MAQCVQTGNEYSNASVRVAGSALKSHINFYLYLVHYVKHKIIAPKNKQATQNTVNIYRCPSNQNQIIESLKNQLAIITSGTIYCTLPPVSMRRHESHSKCLLLAVSAGVIVFI